MWIVSFLTTLVVLYIIFRIGVAMIGVVLIVIGTLGLVDTHQTLYVVPLLLGIAVATSLD